MLIRENLKGSDLVWRDAEHPKFAKTKSAPQDLAEKQEVRRTAVDLGRNFTERQQESFKIVIRKRMATP